MLYLPNYNPMTFQSFDDKDSPQHLFYFLSQTGQLRGHVQTLTKIFVSILEESAFTWFMQLPSGAIKLWSEAKIFFCTKELMGRSKDLFDVKILLLKMG